MSIRHLWSTPTLSNVRREPGDNTGIGSILEQLPSAKLITLNGYVPQKQSLKFKKDKRIRMGTTANIGDESDPPQHKPCVKISESAYLDNIRGDNPQSSRRVRKDGEFSKIGEITHSRIYGMNDVEKRTLYDIGIANNRRRLVTEIQTGSAVKAKRNPIVIGDHQNVVKERPVWKQERMQRDNGKEAKETLKWDTTKRIKSYKDLGIHSIKKQ